MGATCAWHPSRSVVAPHDSGACISAHRSCRLLCKCRLARRVPEVPLRKRFAADGCEYRETVEATAIGLLHFGSALHSQLWRLTLLTLFPPVFGLMSFSTLVQHRPSPYRSPTPSAFNCFRASCPYKSGMVSLVCHRAGSEFAPPTRPRLRTKRSASDRDGFLLYHGDEHATLSLK